ncbi:DNA-binding transcriptional regulator [Haematobacter genomosp. 1]|uniref:Transcriptional regulator n=1 Tax=Haematobacter genomosp. 1 TaxID=366618 RepID=A0A212AAI3_9RHOB|nr:DNA-binding transcriptional regulator [Haematobacter genomosp. 1]OWJ77157.1 transcriptional regulator [Haematobacter genomosp. 1]
MSDDTNPRSRGETVRALRRGLDILRFVNASGGARPAEIAHALGIPRPTVYRLVETLEEEGYVTLSPTSTVVRITRQAAALGDAYARTSRLCQAAGPLLSELGQQLLWPLDLSVYDNAAMVIQETTHPLSPMSIDRAMIGYRLPVLRTSAGRAYLAFIDAGERGLILEHLRRLGEPTDIPFLDPGWLDRTIAQTRERGFSIRDAGEFRAQTASLAAPILQDGVVLGCISVIWIRSALRTPAAIDTCAVPVCATAARIGAVMARDTAKGPL